MQEDGSHGVSSAVVAQLAFPAAVSHHEELKPGKPSLLVVPFYARESQYSMCN